MSGWTRLAALAGALLLSAAGAAWADQGGDSLRTLRQGIVNIDVQVDAKAHSAATMGQHRRATGVVIDDSGLIVTAGYVILEAASVEITGPDGKEVPGTVVAYHAETGFGLVRPLRPISGVHPIPLGKSGAVSVKDPVLILAYGGGDGVTSGLVVSRRTFTGYWEYILEDPLYTVPAVQNFAGAALVDSDFTLIGVGSLIVDEAVDPDVSIPGNLFLPIDALKPVLGELTRLGHPSAPARPWLGVNVIEQFGRVVVARVTHDGPAQKTGIGAGDMIFEVAGQRVTSVEEFYRALWRQGQAGVPVPLTVLQQQAIRQLTVSSGDRYQFYRIHPLY